MIKRQGLALLLVVFIIALATILVTSLTYSTFLSSQAIGIVEREVQAEYILKSLVNFSRAIVAADQTKTFDGPNDPWALFANGMLIPPEQLGIQAENTAAIDLEISPTNTRFNLNSHLDPTNSDTDRKFARVLRNLFVNLGFDENPEEDLLTGKTFDTCQMVANLIDYQDPDNISIALNDPLATFSCQGYEDLFPVDSVKNDRVKQSEELLNIPGFTPNRVRALAPYITFEGVDQININFASDLVLKSLDALINDQVISELREYINANGGFEQPSSFINHQSIQAFSNNFSGLVTTSSNRFHIIARVSYGDKQHFVKATINDATQGQLPEIWSLQLY